MEQLENIVFEDCDDSKCIAEKTFSLWVGTSELKPKLAKLGITYSKVIKGLHTFYCLKGKEIGTLKIKL